MKKRLTALMLIFCLLLSGCQVVIQLPAVEEASPDQDFLTVHYIDVGQADCILVESWGEYLLIDGGNVDDGRLVVSYLQDLGVRELAAVICTHAHEDHVGGLPAVLAVYPAQAVYAPTKTHASQCYDDFLRYVDQQRLEVTLPEPGATFSLGLAQVEILGPRRSYEEVNDSSIVCRITYGETSFLFTGDMEQEAERDLMNAGVDLKADVLKLGHHGSSTSSGYRFLYEVDPEYAVISLGAGNTYGHPHWEPMERLEQAGIPTLRTDKLGTIRAVSDGITIGFYWENQQGLPDFTDYAPGEYIGNKKSMTFHAPSCDSLPSLKNQVALTGYREAIGLGYVPCYSCLGG